MAPPGSGSKHWQKRTKRNNSGHQTMTQSPSMTTDGESPNIAYVILIAAAGAFIAGPLANRHRSVDTAAVRRHQRDLLLRHRPLAGGRIHRGKRTADRGHHRCRQYRHHPDRHPLRLKVGPQAVAADRLRRHGCLPGYPELAPIIGQSPDDDKSFLQEVRYALERSRETEKTEPFPRVQGQGCHGSDPG